jgi:hyperosmotically inducible protein
MNKALKMFAILSLSALAACSSTGNSTSNSAGTFVDDSTKTAEIKSNILKDQSLKGMDIHVETQNNTVQLSGFVKSQEQKDNAQRIAQNTKGVQSVNNNIIVQ